MKNTCIALALIALSLTSCKDGVRIQTTTTEATNDTIPVKDTVNDKPLDSLQTEQAWKDYATPGFAHKMMADEQGSWNATMTFWTNPDALPEAYTSTAEVRMILGGHYQETSYSGNMMGMPFEGKSTLAYNNKSGEYTSTWIDNMSTGMMVTKGHYDEAVKAINLTGQMIDPISGKNINIREVYTFVDANTRKLETYNTKQGQKEFKSMEIVLKRKR
jgi:hypothetical protein